MERSKEVFTISLKDAIDVGFEDKWRESHKLNCDCARAIEKAIDEHYKDNVLGDCAKEIIDEYGFNRVRWVLANTLQQKLPDGRFSKENEQWANTTYIPKDDVRWHFCVESHPGLTDIFLNQFRKEWDKLGLFDYKHCIPDSRTNEDFTDKVLVLRGFVLKDEYKTPDYQLFLARTGFGCNPDASGRKVFGKFLLDGEECSFNRSDFAGVIKDEYLPEWAKEKLTELQTAEQSDSETEGITMGEIK